MRVKGMEFGRLTALGAAATLVTGAASAQPLFEENWDDGNGAMRWSAPIETAENDTIPFDGTVDYAFDYSTIGAPSAPNSTGGTTVGVFMETNTVDDGEVDEGESIGIVPLADVDLSGDFVYTADTYVFWNGGGGSTEYATFGVFSGGTAAPLRFGLDAGDGVAWQIDSDGDSGTDILRYENPPITDPATPTTEFGLGGYEDIPDGTIPGVPTGDATQIGPFNQWVELKIERAGDTLSFSINGHVIDSIDVAGVTDGTILIGQSDPFNSVNIPLTEGGPTNGVVFDNIVVVPEPASLALLGLGGLAALRRRRA